MIVSRLSPVLAGCAPDGSPPERCEALPNPRSSLVSLGTSRYDTFRRWFTRALFRPSSAALRDCFHRVFRLFWRFFSPRSRRNRNSNVSRAIRLCILWRRVTDFPVIGNNIPERRGHTVPQWPPGRPRG